MRGTHVPTEDITTNKPHEQDDRCPWCNYRWLTATFVPASDELPGHLRVECSRCGGVYRTRHADWPDDV